MLIRKHRKRKRGWIGASVFLLVTGLLPAQAASPALPTPIQKSSSPPTATVCGQEAPLDSATVFKGSCDLGGDCCHGYPEAICNRPGGGGFESV